MKFGCTFFSSNFFFAMTSSVNFPKLLIERLTAATKLNSFSSSKLNVASKSHKNWRISKQHQKRKELENSKHGHCLLALQSGW